MVVVFGVGVVDMGEGLRLGESVTRTAETLLVLPELNLRTRSRSSFSREGVGEFRWDA